MFACGAWSYRVRKVGALGCPQPGLVPSIKEVGREGCRGGRVGAESPKVQTSTPSAGLGGIEVTSAIIVSDIVSLVISTGGHGVVIEAIGTSISWPVCSVVRGFDWLYREAQEPRAGSRAGG